MRAFYEAAYRPLTTFVMTDPNFPAHMQASIELLYMVSGQANVTIDSICYTMEGGDIALVAPYQIHSFHSDSSSGLNFMQLAICPLGECADFASLLSKNVPVSPIITAEKLPSDIPHCMKQCQQYQRNNSTLMKAYLQLVLAHFISLSEFMPICKNASEELTERIVAYLSSNFNMPITLEMLAQEFGSNRFSISRIFNQKFKTTFPLYINALRIDHALSLLTSTDYRITNIAMECGYESFSTFSRVFKEFCGISPKEYRNRNAMKSGCNKCLL